MSHKDEVSAAPIAGMIARAVMFRGAEETLLHETAASDLSYGDLSAELAARSAALHEQLRD
jgi:hypothetical protein